MDSPLGSSIQVENGGKVILSPFLFLIGVEFLTRLIFREESLNHLHRIKASRKVPHFLPYLIFFFVDDVTICSRANANEVKGYSELSQCLF